MPILLQLAMTQTHIFHTKTMVQMVLSESAMPMMPINGMNKEWMHHGNRKDLKFTKKNEAPINMVQIHFSFLSIWGV